LLANFHHALQSGTQQDFISLSLVIPGTKEPAKQMNGFLHLLMEEMKEL
jgi:hypothetical protein